MPCDIAGSVAGGVIADGRPGAAAMQKVQEGGDPEGQPTGSSPEFKPVPPAPPSHTSNRYM